MTYTSAIRRYIVVRNSVSETQIEGKFGRGWLHVKQSATVLLYASMNTTLDRLNCNIFYWRRAKHVCVQNLYPMEA